MSAPIGNEYYLLRKHDGRFRKISEPKEIIEALPKYIETSLSNPWVKYEAIKSGDRAGELIKIPNVSTMSKEGFALFCGVSAWRVLESLKEVSEDFLQVVTYAEEVIRTYQLEGSMAGAFNSSVISSYLGLVNRNSLKFEDDDIEESILFKARFCSEKE